MSSFDIRQVDGGVAFGVKVVPNSSKTAIVGELNGMLKVKLAAAPEKGKANQALVKFLVKTLDVKKKAVSIISGKSSPVKEVKVCGVSEEYVRKGLELTLETCV